MSEPTTHVRPSPVVMLKTDDVARMIGCSDRHIRRLVASGRMPRPIKLGRLKRWNAEVIHTWIDAGCPSVESTRLQGKEVHGDG